MEKGWIKVHRQLQECPIWYGERFSKGQAWVDLLLLANHRDKKILFNGEMIVVERGQYLTSMVKLAEKWKWSRPTVLKFLNLLEKDKMITRKSDNTKTLITIENYREYQDFNEDDLQPTLQPNLQPTLQPNLQHSLQPTLQECCNPINNPLYTNNNDKNIKNDKNNIISGTQEHSFARHTNVQNLDYVISHNDLTVDSELYLVMVDWMEYKDHKKKGQNHYDTEKGITTLITKFNKNCNEYGLDAVRHAVEESIANNYQGIVWEKAQQFRSGKGNYTYKPQQTTTSNDLDPQIQAQLRALEERQNETLAEFDNLTDEEIDRMCRGEL